MVTGAAGFIGSTLCRRLLEDGHRVVGVDCLTDAYDRSLKEANLAGLLSHPRFRLVRTDLSQGAPPELVDVDVVYHLAGQASVTRSWGSGFAPYARNNVAATQVLLEACLEAPRLERLVYASSSSVYGDARHRPTTEDELPHPISPYGVSKLAAEHLCLAYHEELDLPVTCLRYFTVYGPRQRPDMGMHRLLRAALRGEPFSLRGDGSASRDFTFVDDAVEVTYRAGTAGRDGVFNIGGGQPVTVAEVVATVEELVGPVDVVRVAEAAGDAGHTAADTARARSLLGYRPRTDLRDGLAVMAAWAADTFVARASA